MTKWFVDWGHWGIHFWMGDALSTARAQFGLSFPVGSQGPQDGSVEHERYKRVCREWTEAGVVPDGACCAVAQRWLYDERYSNARWTGDGWLSPIFVHGVGWTYPRHHAA